jgi:hypothetical protein
LHTGGIGYSNGTITNCIILSNYMKAPHRPIAVSRIGPAAEPATSPPTRILSHRLTITWS